MKKWGTCSGPQRSHFFFLDLPFLILIDLFVMDITEKSWHESHRIAVQVGDSSVSRKAGQVENFFLFFSAFKLEEVLSRLLFVWFCLSFFMFHLRISAVKPKLQNVCFIRISCILLLWMWCHGTWSIGGLQRRCVWWYHLLTLYSGMGKEGRAPVPA